MAEILVSTFLMGLVLIAITVMFQRSGRVGDDAAGEAADGGAMDALSRVAYSPVSWVVGFVLLALGLGGGAILVVAGPDISGALADDALYAVGGFFGALLLGYLTWGVYLSAKSKGIHTAGATALGLWALGLVLCVAVAAVLITT